MRSEFFQLAKNYHSLSPSFSYSKLLLKLVISFDEIVHFVYQILKFFDLQK